MDRVGNSRNAHAYMADDYTSNDSDMHSEVTENSYTCTAFTDDSKDTENTEDNVLHAAQSAGDAEVVVVTICPDFE